MNDITLLTILINILFILIIVLFYLHKKINKRILKILECYSNILEELKIKNSFIYGGNGGAGNCTQYIQIEGWGSNDKPCVHDYEIFNRADTNTIKDYVCKKCNHYKTLLLHQEKTSGIFVESHNPEVKDVLKSENKKYDSNDKH